MARIALVTVLLVVAAALVVGCGPPKEYPVVTPREESRPEQTQGPPTASEPAAKEVLDRAVNVATNGKPELLARGKANRTFEKGRMYLPLGNQKGWIQADRHLETVWPDRLRLVYEMKDPLNKPVTTWIRHPRIWLKDGTEMKDVQNPASAERVAVADAYAQRWLPMMLVGLEPKAVAFDLQQVTVAGTPVQTVKLFLPDLPVFKMTLDAKSHYLVRVEFTITDFGTPVKTVVTMSDHKPVEGLIMPHRIESTRNGEPAEEWTAEKWEFPASIDDGTFSPPQK
jgi:hypothetical protein